MLGVEKKNIRLKLIFCGLITTAIAVASLALDKKPRPFFGLKASKTEVSKVFRKKLPIKNDGVYTTSNGLEYDVRLTIEPDFQKTVERLLRRSQTPYSAFVALDPTTGRVLAFADRVAIRDRTFKDQSVNTRATFPSASVFKVVTAAAALESGELTKDSLIPIRGRYHTLYRQNVLKAGGLNPDSRIRKISFADALAHSVNSVFGKIGIFGVGTQNLRKMANLFGFERQIPFELQVDKSHAVIPKDAFGLAESASGFTRLNTISPLHGALIAASVINDGVIMEPTIVDEMQSRDGIITYSSEPRVFSTPFQKDTAEELKSMMHRAVVRGTSRRSFLGMKRHFILSNLFIGGKTGTLSGSKPVGHYDWFVGFAEYKSKKLAYAALCIHGDRYGIKASLIARKAIEYYFKSVVPVYVRASN